MNVFEICKFSFWTQYFQSATFYLKREVYPVKRSSEVVEYDYWVVFRCWINIKFLISVT